jgi:TPR repeat protein
LDARRRRAVASTYLGIAGLLAPVAFASAGTFEEGVAAQSRGDLPAAMSAFQDAAGRGEDAAEYALGRLYLTGQGGAQDYAAARGWFQKAAAQGNPGAAYQLGQICEGGLGEPRDYAAALLWYRQSAARGYGPAQINLAEMYSRGVGGPRDLPAAIDAIAPAARAGDAAAELELGTLYAEAARAPSHPAAVLNRADFQVLMDRVFGRDNWRETSGYRTPAEENRLRVAGAGTVATGRISHHSLGTADAPGAYDVVVAGMAADDAATRLRRSGAGFSRVLAERAYGEQGPHLHVELALGAASASRFDAAGGRTFSTAGDGATSADLAGRARYWLQLAANHGEAKAARVLVTLQAGHSPG